MAEERQCYGGQWKVPITPYNRRLCWSPSWIECDCGELAKQVYVKKVIFSIQMVTIYVKRVIGNTRRSMEESTLFWSNRMKNNIDFY